MDRVTVRDVAARAGVSAATASRALAGSSRVSPTLAARVQRASAELGFSANVFARALRTQRTDTIGMVVPAINNPYFVGLVEAVEAALAGADKALILCDSRDDVEEEARRVDLLLGRMVDGLVICPVGGTESLPVLRRATALVPTVQLDRRVPMAGVDYCGTDNRAGMAQLLQHLREQGWGRAVYVGSEPTSSAAAERLTGFQEEAARVGVEVVGEHLGAFSSSWGQAAGRALVASGLAAGTAIVCGADVIAFGLLPEVAAAGLVVGRDVAVAGFDDLSFDALLTPALTSVRHPMAELAQAAVATLQARAEAADRATVAHLLAPTLVARPSTQGVPR